MHDAVMPRNEREDFFKVAAGSVMSALVLKA
jgi:hypothetical protein